MRFATSWVLLACLLASVSKADQRAAQRGYQNLTTKAYLPPDFTQETFDAVWRVWPEPLRSQAEAASPAERREMAFERYGLTHRPHDASGKPLQYVVDDETGTWTMNCFACHGGQVNGQSYPGAPNNKFALETLTQEIRLTKLRTKKPLTRMDVGSMVMPLGRTRGTTNAVMFGVALMNYRDLELNIYPNRLPPLMIHHDMDAPAWWHFQRKEMLYIDGFAQKGHRGLMQFNLVRENGPEQFRQWEEEFRDIFAYITSVQSPEYPFAINRELADRGLGVFSNNCAECHGTYTSERSYPERTVDIDEIGTDRVRLRALTPSHRSSYGKSWFTEFGKLDNVDSPRGYVAPPLDGIWASAPYFHNGSVPTLYHVLHPDKRPLVWQRTKDGFDQRHIGVSHKPLAELPQGLSSIERREIFNTRAFGKSAAGHIFVDRLNPAEKEAVLEYLKTL